jgi:molybdate transport system substrate-binding protein
LLPACGGGGGGGGGGGRHARLHVYCAASLTDVATELAQMHRAETELEWVLNFGSSNQLATQAELGGHADVFLSAGEEEMDRLAERGHLVEGTRRSLIANRLVVIVPRGARRPVSSAELAADWIGRLSIADPEGVPAGRYARAWLERIGIWDDVEARVLPGANVRAALAAVQSGNAEVGVVYRTDAAITDAVEIAFDVPEDESPVISYPVAAIAGRHREAEARAVLAFLGTDAAAEVFARHGFLPATEEAR